MINKFIAHFTGDLFFQGFEFGMVEFDHLAGFDIDEMFMMFARFFIAFASIT